jgi:hypothetical protein
MPFPSLVQFCIQCEIDHASAQILASQIAHFLTAFQTVSSSACLSLHCKTPLMSLNRRHGISSPFASTRSTRGPVYFVALQDLVVHYCCIGAFVHWCIGACHMQRVSVGRQSLPCHCSDAWSSLKTPAIAQCDSRTHRVSVRGHNHIDIPPGGQMRARSVPMRAAPPRGILRPPGGAGT